MVLTTTSDVNGEKQKHEPASCLRRHHMFAVKVAPTELFIWLSHVAELCIRMGRQVTLSAANLVAFNNLLIYWDSPKDKTVEWR